MSIAVHVATTSGHNGFPPTQSLSGNSKLLVEGMPTIMHGTPFAVHCNSSCHSGSAISSTSKLTIGGVAVCVSGDKLSCGDTIVSRSSKLVL